MCSSMRACMFVFVFACLFAHVLCYLTKKHEAKEAMRLCMFRLRYPTATTFSVPAAAGRTERDV